MAKGDAGGFALVGGKERFGQSEVDGGAVGGVAEQACQTLQAMDARPALGGEGKGAELGSELKGWLGACALSTGKSCLRGLACALSFEDLPDEEGEAGTL